MSVRSVFEIIGPVMVGPSSSHTAGAVRIGNVARAVLGEEIRRAKITLYGSFAKTYKGHGTDRALVAGLLGLPGDDPGIKDSLSRAAALRLEVRIGLARGEEFHPNTADIELTGVSGKRIFLRGSSVGGGNILITRINQYDLSLTANEPTLIVEHVDRPGVVGRVAGILGDNGINIVEMRVTRGNLTEDKIMVLETYSQVPDEILEAITRLPNVTDVIRI
ncbi:MAG: L-serine dehydratase [Clostridia bacterium]|uniref:L-serine deaminase n=1 Tax=Thermacetogenium phaeum TaxID=85874 RepID=A0A101FH87_9THEO|nr:MAG: L-serine dehydratase beta subunit [Thermacetogenium phaeum]MDK2881081.1 L-serine dehydratase [Clostridia bacterium]MDN5365836.1 L-serine dehydratase [Thermacetogenium sp.]